MNEMQNTLIARLTITGKLYELDQYKKLKTDQERIVFTLNLMQEYDIIPSATDISKSAKESEKLREQGNKVFVKGVFSNMTCIDALKLYTRSIAFAPYPSEQLALGYANRSAVLFQLGLYTECIQDIDRALALDYPDNLRAKIHLRKAECLIILRNHSIEGILEEAQHWLDRMSVSDTSREKLKSKLDILHDKTVQTELHAVITNILEPPPLPIIQTHNIEVPCASDAVAIKYNKHYGRHVVATRNIEPGEVIAVEKLYSLISVPENMQMHCSNCLRLCWANIPCNYCTYVMYCSEECRNDEWKKCHDIECTVFPALMEHADFKLNVFSIRLAMLALREAGSIIGLRAMLKEVDEHEDPRTKGFSRDGKLHSDRYISVYSLATNTESRSVSDLFKRSFDVSFFLYFLATRTVIFGTKLPEDFSVLAKNNDVTFFGGLILRHQQIISCNTHSFGETRGLQYVEQGIAVVPFQGLLNHSCSPNILKVMISKHVVIYAMYPIQKGEQLLDNYNEHFAVTPRETRQQHLLKHYYFTCNCIPCQENWPLYHEFQSYKTLVKRAEDKAKIKKALRKYNVYAAITSIARVQDKYFIGDLRKMIKVLYDCAPMPCKEMADVTETLKQVYHFNENIHEIRTHRK